MYTRRFTKGLTSNVSYTWSHATSLGVLEQMGPANNLECPRYGCVEDNPYNTSSPTVVGQHHDYGNSDLDMRQRLSYMTSYDLPFGNSSKGLVGALVKGWGASMSGYWQTGMPFSVQYNGMLAGAINGPRADQLASATKIAPVTLPNGTTCTPPTGAVFNTCAFMVPNAGRWGNERRDQLFGPHTWTVNGQAGKTFAITERYKLNFRAESFNLTNTTNDAQPNASVGNGNFGKISRTGSAGRQFQFGLRLSY
jgi:hypothetical protein